jgi:hypothetical protein
MSTGTIASQLDQLDIPNWPSRDMSDARIQALAAEIVQKSGGVLNRWLSPTKQRALTAPVYDRVNMLKTLRAVYYCRLQQYQSKARQKDLSGMRLDKREKHLLSMKVGYNMGHRNRKELVRLLKRIHAYLLEVS